MIMMGALWFLLIRPQQKRAREHRELVRSLVEGDEVVTNAGIHGVVVEVEPTVVWLEVAPDVEMKISREAVAGRTSGHVAESEDEAADDESMADDSSEKS